MTVDRVAIDTRIVIIVDTDQMMIGENLETTTTGAIALLMTETGVIADGRKIATRTNTWREIATAIGTAIKTNTASRTESGLEATNTANVGPTSATEIATEIVTGGARRVDRTSIR